MMRLRLTLAATLACASLLPACTPPTPAQVTQREDALTASGFKVIPANTPDRQASMALLPPNKFVRQERDGVPMMVYSDPTVCNCVYIGDLAAYQAYKAAMRQQNRIAAEEASAKVAKMDWGAWPAFGP
ncbi:MAG: hypothetical protein ACJ8AW_38045 [Rhodopila sp.]